MYMFSKILLSTEKAQIYKSVIYKIPAASVEWTRLKIGKFGGSEFVEKSQALQLVAIDDNVRIAAKALIEISKSLRRM